VADAGDDGGHVRVAIVGTGFAGIGASVALQREGIDHTILERAADVGGTWRDNRYPGCRCDVPSHLYSFSFAPNPEWTETYSPQPEILAYLRRTAERFGVLDRIRFGHEVRGAVWDADRQRWRLDTTGGPLTADLLVLGNGPLAEPSIPDLPGLDSFGGTTFHSATWPADDDADLDGRSVAVIGTGSSAVQFIPLIQPRVAALTVFQRTAPWVLPHTNRRVTRAERALYRRFPRVQQLVRQGVYWSREVFATTLLRNSRSLDRLEKVGRGQIEKQVTDPALRARLTPDYRPGCKRLLLSNDYYPSLEQSNVEVVTDKIAAVTPTGIVTTDGTTHEVDTIIFGTGFHVTDNPVAGRVRGADGRTLAGHWAGTGAYAYLGTAVPGFPNLFLLAGPNTGIGHTSLVVMIEAQLTYLVGALRFMDRSGVVSLDLRPRMYDAWAREIERRAAPTVWNSGGCSSWYLDAEGRNTTIWPDHTFRFRRRTARFDALAYHHTRRP
jgi:cation diffusion facilitator CzcD-associated flavoprotein CzcO